MPTTTLKLENLHLIPGLAEDFDQQVQNLVEDCKKRPGLQKARKLTVELSISPHEQDPNDVGSGTALGRRCKRRMCPCR